MYRKLAVFLGVLMLLSFTGAVSIDDFQTYLSGSPENVFEPGENITFEVNATNSTSADLKVSDSSGSTVADTGMKKISDGNFQLYQYNYTISNDPAGGDWRADVNVSNSKESVTERESFHVANDTPHFLSLSKGPSRVGVGENVTITANITDSGDDLDSAEFTLVNNSETVAMKQVGFEDSTYTYEVNYTAQDNGYRFYEVKATDSGGRSNTAEDFFTVFSDEGSSTVAVEVAPSCSTSLDYFLIPGNGEIVQNKTGVFVEILSNSGNVESNITVEYLNVTYEKKDAWSPGEPKGPVIRSYAGDFFSNIRLGESITYFKLFKASEPIGNYTGRSGVSTECRAEGPQNSEEKKSDLETTYACGDTNQSEFFCYNLSVTDTTLSTSETTTANFTEVTSETVDDQVQGSDGYETNITLNSTEYTAFTFNTTSTVAYDYSCVSNDSTIDDESEECAFEDNLIDAHLIKVTDIGFDGRNATYALQEENEDLLNTTLGCDSLDPDTALCNYTFIFFEQFDFYGNFEIVEGIGDKSGGVNDTGNQTTNQTIAGNNSNPGQTEVPEPVPEPEPEPTPDPVVRVDIESLKEKYTTSQGQFVAANFTVRNIGTADVSGLSLISQIGRLDSGWESRTATVDNLAPGENVTTQVFVRPSESTDPGTYVVPVSAEAGDQQLDFDFFTVKVREGVFEPSIAIEEAPRSLEVSLNSSNTIPLLVSNDGTVPVNNITGRIQNVEGCGSVSSGVIDRLKVNESSSLELELDSVSRSAECNATIVVSTASGAFAFSDIQITVVPEPGLIPRSQRVPFLALVWTVVLAAFAVSTREYHLESWLVKGPYVMLIVGEAIILVYSVVNYYSLPVASILPF